MLTKITGKQEKPLSQIKADLAKNRLTHAYLFVGPKGSGKKDAAKLIFRLANGHTEDCNCDSCHQVNADSHPDLSVISPDGRFITIKQVKNTQHYLSLVPLTCKVKMAIFTDAQEFNVESSNALLKTLEEPLENTIIVLLSSIPERLLPTIRSRCRTITFNNSTPKEVEEYLTEKGIEKVKSRVASYVSGGIISKALQFSESKSFWRGREK